MFVAMSLIVAGSVLNGLWAYPMKLVKGWRWENIWFLFGVFGLVLFPWLAAWTTVPQLMNVYAAAPRSLLAAVLGLGCAWGVGSLMFGLGVSALGLALGYAIIIGTTAVLGTVVPALSTNLDVLSAERAAKLGFALLTMVAGLVCFSVAGRKRDALTSTSPEATSYQILTKTRFVRGFAICLLAGVLSACFNIGFAITDRILKAAVASGASAASAVNAVWALVMGAGFVPSALYCFFLFRKNNSLGQFRSAPVNWLYACVMGLLWMGGVILYGVGAVRIGRAGASLGWPVLMSATVIVANVLGLATGEWAGTGWSTKRYLLVGTLLLIAAVSIIGWSGA